MVIKSIFSDAAKEVLKEVGLLKPIPDGTSNEKNRLSEILSESSLSLEQTIQQLGNIVHESRDESIKLRGIDTALKLHRVMNDDSRPTAPQIVINISSPGGQNGITEGRIPSILIPRDLNSEVIINA